MRITLQPSLTSSFPLVSVFTCVNMHTLALLGLACSSGRQFDPDLVIISAGFDAAEGDPLGGCAITPIGT